MELWLLGAGAIVLIAIALWIVWPASPADASEPTVPGEEVSRTRMNENGGVGMAPQGDRFEDQYTSATGDLSAGGVATALESLQGESAGYSPSVAASRRWSSADTAADYSSPFVESTQARSLTAPRTIGIGAGVLLTVGGAIGGAFLYARWQRERNKPINRLRRGARDVAGRIGERMPDVEDLPRGAAPMSGAATALLLTGILASRALRRGSSDGTEEVRDQATEVLRDSLREAVGRGREAVDRGRDVAERGRKAAEYGRKAAKRGRERLPERVEPQRPALMGIGFGGLAVLVGGAYLVWRLLRGGSSGASRSAY